MVIWPNFRESLVPNHIQTTTTQLLDGLRDSQNREVWTEFDQRYRPVIFAVALRMGLKPEDAGDVAQQTLTDFVRDYQRGKYDRSRGRLRTWLKAIARNRSIDVLRLSPPQRGANLGDAAMQLPDPHEIDALWEQEEQRAILAEAMRRLETTGLDEKTIRAFDLVFVQKMPAEEAAVACGLSIESVHQARTRVVRRLAGIVHEITKAYDEDA